MSNIEDLKSRLDRVSKKSASLKSEVSRIEGRREEAQSRLETLRDEFRAKGIDPDSADDMLKKLTAKLEKVVIDFEKKIEDAENELAPYLERL